MEEKIKIKIDPVKYVKNMARQNNKLKPLRIHNPKKNKKNKINIVNEWEEDDISLLAELDRR